MADFEHCFPWSLVFWCWVWGFLFLCVFLRWFIGFFSKRFAKCKGDQANSCTPRFHRQKISMTASIILFSNQVKKKKEVKRSKKLCLSFLNASVSLLQLAKTYIHCFGFWCLHNDDPHCLCIYWGKLNFIPFNEAAHVVPSLL